MGKYRTLGTLFNRVFRNDLNKNFEDIDADIKAQKTYIDSEIATQKKRVDDLIINTPQPSEVVDARGGHPVLRDRLDSVDEQLSQIAVNIKAYGAKLDGVTDDTDAIKLAISENIGGAILIPENTIITDTIIVPENTTVFATKKIQIFAKGTGNKTHTIPNANSTIIENTEINAPYLADSDSRGNQYKTLDLTNPFSAAFILEKGASMINIDVIPYFDGDLGYKGADGRLSDEWDVGVWARNADNWRLDNCRIVGHWRKTALLVSSHNLGDGIIPANELGQALNCHFTGFRGVTIRNPVTDTGSTNYGFAGTDFINCYIKSLDHQSKHLATSSFLETPFDSPSACLEIDGTVVRGVQFTNCTFMGRDDLNMIFNHASEIMFIGCYHEAKSIMVNGSWLNPSVGSRVAATSNTKALRFIGSTLYGVDMSPYFRNEPSADRYTVDGVFNPTTCQRDEETFPMFSSSSGMKLSRGQNAWKIWDYVFNELWKFTSTNIVTGSETFNLLRKSNGTEQYIMRVYSTGNVEFPNGETYFGKLVRPVTDNNIPLGASSYRWSTLYAGTGTINTSDLNTKQQIKPIDDAVLDAWADVNYSQFKFNDAVQQKGDEARWHFGLIAQEIEEVFARHGLNAFEYGILCYDEWDDEYDEDGNLIREAGGIYSIRPNECLMLEAALMRRELNKREV